MQPRETIAALLQAAKLKLADAGIPTTALDARLLLQAVTGLDHASMIVQSGDTVDSQLVARFQELMRRRALLEPVSKILGVREFYGRSFHVSQDVLDPRPDTETVIDLCLQKFAVSEQFHFLDLGCGSGAIAVTLLAERPIATGTAVDISNMALEMTRKNAVLHGVGSRLLYLSSDWFGGVDGKYNLIVSNPPYIPTDIISGLDIDVRQHDPHLALDGGVDGLACYRLLAAGAVRFLTKGGLVAVEAGAGQAYDVIEIFQGNGFKAVDQSTDLAGNTRAVAFMFA
jgi:release factor glutamine methyltransferase